MTNYPTARLRSHGAKANGDASQKGRPVVGVFDHDNRFGPIGCAIARLDVADHRRDGTGFDQRDHSPTKTAARHAGTAQTTDYSAGFCDQFVDGRKGDFEIVAHRGVRGRHQVAERDEIARRHSLCRCDGAGIFGNDMARAAIRQGIETGACAFQRRKRHIAQHSRAQSLRDAFALRATLIIGAVNQAANFGR